MIRVLFASLCWALACHAVAADPAKVLRVASPDIETLDPQQFSDDPSFKVLMAIFEPAFEWDYLASPPTLTPVTAASPLEITEGGKIWTIRLKRGIYFTDDPAFKGKPRELTAEDYAYSYRRWLDPNGRRGGTPEATNVILGARPVVDAASASGKFDYDRPIEGLRVIDRYTLQLRLSEPNYPVIRDMLGFVGAVAREVVEATGPSLRTHPVGTGPFQLREWKPGSRLILDANPGYRDIRFPASSNPAHAALERSMKDKVLPQIGVIEINVIDEDLTRLLKFEQAGLDIVELRGEVASRLLADGKLKAEYTSRGITRSVFTEPFTFSVYFNIADPAIGGMGKERVALRRAIALAFDADALIKVVYAGQAIPANQIVPPGVGGHDPKLPVRSIYDPATANTLLDRFGYKLGADGHRTTPEGKPLTIILTQRTGAISREIATLWKRNMDAVGLNMDFREMPFQDAIKEIEKGKFQIYYGGFGGSPSGFAELIQLESKQPRRVNATNFNVPEYDRAFALFLSSPDDGVQIAAARTMSELALTYMPQLPVVFRSESHFIQPWVQGFSPPVFSSYWKYLDIDLDQRQRSAAKQ